MASDRTTILEDLPGELIGQCFSHLSSSKEDIRNIRLVSKRCSEIASPFLIDFVRVFIGSQSLELFETLSRHPVFSKSIREIEFNVSYFDNALASSFHLYGKNCGTSLFQTLEVYERWGGDEELDTGPLHNTVDQWEAIPNEGFDKSNCSERQRFLLLAHGEYCRRWEDQESVKRGSMHVTRISEALSRFNNIQTVSIDDNPRYGSGEPSFTFTHESETGFVNRMEELVEGESGASPAEHERRRTRRAIHKRMLESRGDHEFSDKGLMKRCLNASEWKGTFQTWNVTAPPVELISQLFEALSEASVRPTKFKISFTPPNDLRCLRLTESQQDTIRSVLRQARELSFRVRHWARRGSLAEDNSRSNTEMLALCSISYPFFSSKNLTSLDISFDDYPVFYEFPRISMSEILPLANSWPSLREINLRHIPFRTAELTTLVHNMSGTVEHLIFYTPYLLDGSWTVPLDILRRLERLKDFEFLYPQGAEFGERSTWFKDFPTAEIVEYVLRLRDRNPLLDFKWEER